MTATYYPEENSGLTAVMGRNGDGHSPRLFSFDLTHADGTMTYRHTNGWADGTVEACDVINIVADEVYITCTYMNDIKSLRRLPLLARFRLSDLGFERLY